MTTTKIEWCDATVNPVIGCTFGCEFCYARTMNKRFKWTEDFSKPEFRRGQLQKLISKKPKNIFMDSMSDIADWKDEWMRIVAKMMKENPQHNYLFLSKRPDEASYILGDNVWNGTSIVNEVDVSRFNYLPAVGNRFVSIEPIHEHFQIEEKHNLLPRFVDWVIIGAETGNRKNKIIPQKSWIDDIVTACEKERTPVFMKESLLPIIGEENMLRQFPQGLRI